MNKRYLQGKRILRLGATAFVVSFVLSSATPGYALADSKKSLFGSTETALGSTNEHLSADRYRRLLPVDYNLTGEAAEHWKILNDLLRYQSLKNKLRLTQQFFNTVQYLTDEIAFGQADYWASIGEFISTGGDCEDFAIAKYRALVDAGFPAEQLRVVLVEDTVTGLDHAVLSAELDGQTYILDNQYSDVMDAHYVNTYRPLYSMNQYTIWVHQKPAASDNFVSVQTNMPTKPAGGQ